MENFLPSEETATAWVRRVHADLVVCRYKKGAHVDADAVAENLAARLRFPGSDPYAVICIFPEDVNFDMSMLRRDHYANLAADDPTQVLAIVTEDVQTEPMARLYLAFYPTRFNSAVFATEAEAENWVNGRILKHRSKNG